MVGDRSKDGDGVVAAPALLCTRCSGNRAGAGQLDCCISLIRPAGASRGRCPGLVRKSHQRPAALCRRAFSSRAYPSRRQSCHSPDLCRGCRARDSALRRMSRSRGPQARRAAIEDAAARLYRAPAHGLCPRVSPERHQRANAHDCGATDTGGDTPRCGVLRHRCCGRASSGALAFLRFGWAYRRASGRKVP